MALFGFLPPRSTPRGEHLAGRLPTNLAAIGYLSIGFVLFALGVALVITGMLPVPFAALRRRRHRRPPDAVAAVAVARSRSARRVAPFWSESLLNDATALVSLRTAVALGRPSP